MNKLVITALLGLILVPAHAQQRLAMLPRLHLPALSNRAFIGGSLVVLGCVVGRIVYNARSQSRILPKPSLPQPTTIVITAACLKKAMDQMQTNWLEFCQQSAGLDVQIHDEDSKTLDKQRDKRYLEIYQKAQKICASDPVTQQASLQAHFSTTIRQFQDELKAKEIALAAARARNEALQKEYAALQATITS